MGLLDGLLGNASKVDISLVTEELSPILPESETVVEAYKVVRDLKIWVSGQSEPIETNLKSGLAQDVQKTLANMMFSS
nr:hypothetical protein [uncultured Glaciecola sp.]